MLGGNTVIFQWKIENKWERYLSDTQAYISNVRISRKAMLSFWGFFTSTDWTMSELIVMLDTSVGIIFIQQQYHSWDWCTDMSCSEHTSSIKSERLSHVKGCVEKNHGIAFIWISNLGIFKMIEKNNYFFKLQRYVLNFAVWFLL